MRQAECAVLRWKGLPIAAIAETLGTSEGVVTVSLSKGRKKLPALVPPAYWRGPRA